MTAHDVSKMKVLYLTLEPPMDPALVARGNVLRARQLVAGLRSRGVDVVQVWRAPYDGSEAGPHPRMYQDPEELGALIDAEAPDAVLLAYWNLVGDLPESLSVPVVVDFIAPRPLEALFEDPATRDTQLRDLLDAFQRASGFVVANRRQEHLLIPYLLLAGHDLRERVPIAHVPIAAPRPFPEPARLVSGPVTLVGGGVEWPWRRQRRWLDLAAEEVRRHRGSARLVEFRGRYPRIVERRGPVPDMTKNAPVCHLDLLSWAEYSRFLSGHAQVGLELADENVERRFSHSFRVVDYLTHGLPVICNRYLPIADLVTRYDAGWGVNDSGDLRVAIGEAVGRPDLWGAKSANAVKLAENELDADTVINPLAGLLDDLIHPPVASSTAGGAFVSLSEQDRAEFERLRAAASSRGPTSTIQERTIEDLRRQVRELHHRNYRLSLELGGKRRPPVRHVLRQAVHEVVGKFPKPGDEGPPRNVVVVTRSDLYPTEHGGAVKIVETARGLSRLGQEVGIVSDRRDVWWHYRDGKLDIRRFPRWLGMVALPPGVNSLYHQYRDYPLSNSFLYRPLSDLSYLWRALYVARKLEANVYQAEFPAFALPCLRLRSLRGGRVIVVEHNVEYARLREQDPDLTDEQYDFLKELELGLCNQADAVVCVSEGDRLRLAADGVAETLLRYVPHGVDLGAFDAASGRDVRSELKWDPATRVLVYHGTFEYPPNLEAVKTCAREVLPRLARRGIRVRLLAIGPHPPAEPIHPDIHFTGGIESVAGLLKGSDAAVVPLTSGGGTRMKILDYFACGVPVVSTAKGIEGIPAQSGREAFVADDWEAFSDRVAELLADPDRRKRMAAAARAWVEPLDWLRIAERYLAIFNEAPVGRH